jgi:HSP20 family protein
MEGFRVDVKQAEQEVVIYADLPGIDEDDIRVDLQGNLLRISGAREFNHDAEDSEEYVQLERPFGRFVREISLIGKLDEQRVTAKYNRGVLKVRIPKMQTR